MFSKEFIAKINARLEVEKPLSCVGCPMSGISCAGCNNGDTE